MINFFSTGWHKKLSGSSLFLACNKDRTKFVIKIIDIATVENLPDNEDIDEGYVDGLKNI